MNWNSKIYNYTNLNDRDKSYFRTMAYMLENVEMYISEYEHALSMDGEHSIIDAMKDEISLEVLKSVKQAGIIDLEDFIVSCIDTYEEEIKEIDTEDMFYGYKSEQEEKENDN